MPEVADDELIAPIAGGSGNAKGEREREGERGA